MQPLHAFHPVPPGNSQVTQATPSHSPPSSPCQQSSDTCTAFTPCQQSSDTCNAFILSSQFSLSKVKCHMQCLHTLLPVLPVNSQVTHTIPSDSLPSFLHSPCQQSHNTCTHFTLSLQISPFSLSTIHTYNPSAVLPVNSHIAHASSLSSHGSSFYSVNSHMTQATTSCSPPTSPHSVTQHATTSHCSPTSPHSPHHDTCNRFTLFSPLSLSHDTCNHFTLFFQFSTFSTTHTTSHCSPHSPRHMTHATTSHCSSSFPCSHCQQSHNTCRYSILSSQSSQL